MMYHTSFDNVDKIWFGPKLERNFDEHVSIGRVVLDALAKNSHDVGQVSNVNSMNDDVKIMNSCPQISDNNGITYTNGEIRLMAIRAAQNIVKLGLSKGDVIGFLAPNHHHLVAIVIAALAIGCPINPLDPDFERSEILHMFGITKPKLVICEQGNVQVAKDCLDELQLSALIYTFDAPTVYSCCVDDLLVATHDEDRFVYVF